MNSMGMFWIFIGWALAGLGGVAIVALLVSLAMYGLAYCVKWPMPKLVVVVIDVMARNLVALVCYLQLWIMLIASLWGTICIGRRYVSGDENNWITILNGGALLELIAISIDLLITCVHSLLSAGRSTDCTNRLLMTAKGCPWQLSFIAEICNCLETVCSYFLNMLDDVKDWFKKCQCRILVPFALVVLCLCSPFKGGSFDWRNLLVVFFVALVTLVGVGCLSILLFRLVFEICRLLRHGKLVLRSQAVCMTDSCLHTRSMTLDNQEMSDTNQVKRMDVSGAWQEKNMDSLPDHILAKTSKAKEVKHDSSLSGE